MNSRHDQEPWFGPGLPTWPALSQVVRVFGSPLPGNAYQAWLQQWNGNLVLRDRVLVYVWEPNGIKLQPGFYDARLVGTYQELPLLVTWCCPQAAVFLSSASSMAPTGNCSRCPVAPLNWNITLAGFGGGLSGFNGTWTLGSDGDCSWATFPLLKSLALSIVEPGPQWSFIGTDSSTSAVFTYTLGFNVVQCLGPITLILVNAVNGTAPGTVTFTAG